MRRDQSTLYGMWKIGTDEQRQPVAEAGLFACRGCAGRFRSAQALAVHVKMKHELLQGEDLASDELRTLSLNLQDGLAKLREEKQKLVVEAGGEEVAQEGDEEDGYDERSEGGEEPVQKRGRRGAEKRFAYGGRGRVGL